MTRLRNGKLKAPIVCCDCNHRRVLEEFVETCGSKLQIAADASGAIEQLASESVDAVFCQEGPSDSGFNVVVEAAKGLAVPVIVLSRLAEAGRYLECMELGAFDRLASPYSYSSVASITGSLFDHTHDL